MNLEDIARKAGVSRSTVSRVINHEKYVRENVRRRVLEVIDEEQYQPNPNARALVTRRSNIIGVAIPQTINVFFADNSYFPMLLQGIAETVNRCNHAMMLWTAESNEDREVFSERVTRFRQPDGLIITSVAADDLIFNNLLQHKRRFVMVESPPHHEDQVSYVTVDNIAAAEQVVAHFVALGRCRIAKITGQMNMRDASDRLIGYRNGLERAGLPYDPKLVVHGSFHRETGYQRMRQLLPHRPDAVFCGGDTIAIGALEAIREAGLRVPDDVAVVGFDDLDVAVSADLTTMRHYIQTVGSTAAQLLIDLIEGRLEHPQHIVLPTELIVRGSTVRSS